MGENPYQKEVIEIGVKLFTALKGHSMTHLSFDMDTFKVGVVRGMARVELEYPTSEILAAVPGGGTGENNGT